MAERERERTKGKDDAEVVEFNLDPSLFLQQMCFYFFNKNLLR